ncbi:hypothetical protein ACIKTA_06345 [Hansschlegelia beijingensis]
MSAPEESAAPQSRKPRQPIRDAATLILLDRSASEPKVLMGRRHHAVRFMPGKYVFPGGRVEPEDGRVNVAGTYAPHVERSLQARVGTIQKPFSHLTIVVRQVEAEAAKA